MNAARATILFLLPFLTTSAFAGVIAGKVVDETGQPVGGVEVSVHDPVRDQWVVAESHSSGRFSLAGHWEKPVSFLARKDGFLQVELESVGPIVRDLIVVLRKPGRLAGRVVGPDGAPPKQRVFVNLRPVHPELAAGILRVEAGSDGRFVFEGLRPGWYDALAVARKGPPGVLHAIRVPPREEILVALPDLRALDIVVRDPEGKPVPHAKASVRYLSERWSLGRPPTEDLTDLEGKASLTPLPAAGGAVLVVEAEDRAPIVRRVDLARAGDLELTMRSGDVVEGRGPGGAAEQDRVVIERDDGLPGAAVSRGRGAAFRFEHLGPGISLLTCDLGGSTHFAEFLVKPGRRAKVELGSTPGKPLEVRPTIDGGLAEGEWVAYSAKRNVLRGARGTFAGGAATATGLTIDPLRFLFRRGDVRGILDVRPGRKLAVDLESRQVTGTLRVDGKAARGAMVLLVPLGGPDLPPSLEPLPEPTRTDASGRFEAPRVAGGPWGLLVLDEAHPPRLVPFDGKGETEADLLPGALLRVRVRDAEDRPVLDARIHARDPSGRRVTALPRRTDTDGEVQLLLAPGTWRIEVSAPDLGRVFEKVKLGPEGGETTLVPKLE